VTGLAEILICKNYVVGKIFNISVLWFIEGNKNQVELVLRKNVPNTGHRHSGNSCSCLLEMHSFEKSTQSFIGD
jgi:hypothetical protein